MIVFDGTPKQYEEKQIVGQMRSVRVTKGGGEGLPPFPATMKEVELSWNKGIAKDLVEYKY